MLKWAKVKVRQVVFLLFHIGVPCVYVVEYAKEFSKFIAYYLFEHQIALIERKERLSN